ncbi:MAG: cobyrinate a,c-diamide synthase [Veillonella sp.]|nr:cobyrinate a,c-diamide synthase [Veillonella sp.]
MNTVQIPRVVIAGTNSGVGKTTIVAGLLAAYTNGGRTVQSFKVGPDYIDPGFHKIASGRDSYNLDTWLVPPHKLTPFFATMAHDVDLAIIEGVMGLYDGGREGEVNFGGVILNRLGSANHERMVREGMDKIGVPVIGAIYRDDRMHSPERHLGLTPVTEIDPTEAINTIREAVEKMVNLDALLEIATGAPTIELPDAIDAKSIEKRVKIGVAYDEAFSFYYPASLAALEEKGAELVYFSPLNDSVIPDVDGLVFGGGFPEMFLFQLSSNESMKESIRQANAQDMPIYAECGGLMYLCESIHDFEGSVYKTVGIVPANCVMQQKLQKVGYVTATAKRDTLLGAMNTAIRGHEFHFSTMEPTIDDFPWAFHLEGGRKPQSYDGGYATKNVLASYLHLNFAGSDEGAQHFVDTCAAYKAQK